MSDGEQKKAIVRNFFEEVWNKGNLGHIDEVYKEDFRLNALWQNTSLGGSGTAEGRETAKEVIGRWLDGFPDMHVTVDEQVNEGDFVATQHSATGTHTKDFMGIPATNKGGTITGITITRVPDDQIAEAWTCWDAAGMMMQLGVIPLPPGADAEPGVPRPFDPDADARADPEETKRVVQRFYDELWTQGKLEVADELFAPDFVGHAPGGGTRGPEGVKRLVAEWRDGVPDMVLEIHAQHAEGCRVATRFTGRGKQTGTLLGVPATGKDASLSGIAITRVVDGQVISDWGEFDVVGMFAQLGVAPPGAGAPAGAQQD